MVFVRFILRHGAWFSVQFELEKAKLLIQEWRLGKYKGGNIGNQDSGDDPWGVMADDIMCMHVVPLEAMQQQQSPVNVARPAYPQGTVSGYVAPQGVIPRPMNTPRSFQ